MAEKKEEKKGTPKARALPKGEIDPAIQEAAKSEAVQAAIAKRNKELEVAQEEAKKAEIEAAKKAKKTAEEEASAEKKREEAMLKESAAIAAQHEKQAGKRIFLSKRPGLCLTIQCKDKKWDEHLKKYKTVQGKEIQFEAGRYVTSDKAEIAFLENYMQKKPGHVLYLADHIMVMQRAIEKVKQEELALAGVTEAIGKQGTVSGG